jgi:hypothetical protein
MRRDCNEQWLNLEVSIDGYAIRTFVRECKIMSLRRLIRFARRSWPETAVERTPDIGTIICGKAHQTNMQRPANVDNDKVDNSSMRVCNRTLELIYSADNDLETRPFHDVDAGRRRAHKLQSMSWLVRVFNAN